MTDYESIYDDAYTDSCCTNNTGPLLHLGPRTIDHEAGLAAVVAAAKADAWDEGHSQALANVAWPLEREGNPYRAEIN